MSTDQELPFVATQENWNDFKFRAKSTSGRKSTSARKVEPRERTNIFSRLPTNHNTRQSENFIATNLTNIKFTNLLDQQNDDTLA